MKTILYLFFMTVLFSCQSPEKRLENYLGFDMKKVEIIDNIENQKSGDHNQDASFSKLYKISKSDMKKISRLPGFQIIGIAAIEEDLLKRNIKLEGNYLKKSFENGNEVAEIIINTNGLELYFSYSLL